jgi:hypothetical protein
MPASMPLIPKELLVVIPPPTNKLRTGGAYFVIVLVSFTIGIL